MCVGPTLSLLEAPAGPVHAKALVSPSPVAGAGGHSHPAPRIIKEHRFLGGTHGALMARGEQATESELSELRARGRQFRPHWGPQSGSELILEVAGGGMAAKAEAFRKGTV